MSNIRGLVKHVAAGAFVGAMVFGLVGSSLAAPAAPPNPNGTWAYVAKTSLGTFKGTYVVNQFVYSSTTKCWTANISKTGTWGKASGTLKLCGTKLTGTATGTIFGSAEKGSAKGSANASYTKMSAKGGIKGALLNATATLSATKTSAPAGSASGSPLGMFFGSAVN
jgi:hypothetical protein